MNRILVQKSDTFFLNLSALIREVLFNSFLITQKTPI